MVQFNLPKNSKVEKGKTHNKPVGRKFNIYRFDPEKNDNPKIDTFYIEENKLDILAINFPFLLQYQKALVSLLQEPLPILHYQ